MSSIEKAITIAATAHAGQKDKAGLPYVFHPLRVMLAGATEEEWIAGVLHDLLEDTPWTADDLRREGFREEIVEAVVALSRQPEESYEAFITRAGRNPIARKVKLKDLADNMDLSRIPNPSPKDHARLEKYQRACAELQQGGEE